MARCKFYIVLYLKQVSKPISAALAVTHCRLIHNVWPVAYLL